MINTIRKSRVTKVIASYLAIQMIIQMAQPMQLFALTSGPSQPEFNSFTPIGTSDMVNLSSGNFNYNIPIMDVGGYPLNLAYDSGVTMDQEASWTGLGWNLNVGQINRQVRGIPDDFKGDLMEYENNMKPNVTVGIHTALDPQVFGIESVDGVVQKPKEGDAGGPTISIGMGINYNNYTGISFKPSFGLNFQLTDNVKVGFEASSSATDGATIAPNVSAKGGSKSIFKGAVGGTLNAGVSYNSNRGLTSFNMSAGIETKSFKVGENTKGKDAENSFSTSGSGSISFTNPTWTPRKRTAFTDINGTVAVSVGGDIWGLDGEFELSAMGSIQKIKDPIRIEKAYGYEFTGFAETNDILDYNREKEQLIGKNMLALPTTTYTYDLYSVQGQGAGGMFRPFRSQVGQINDEFIQDESDSFSLGVEIEPGTGQHVGVNFTTAPSESHTGIWNTKALQHFKQEREDTRKGNEKLDYEPVYFKYIGEPRVDADQQLFTELGGYDPVMLKIGGSKKSFNKYADNQFLKKTYNADLTQGEYAPLPSFSSKFKRQTRDVRNQNVQKLTKKELKGFYKKEYYNQRVNKNAAAHHTAEIRVQNADGSTYVFGETAYNKVKEEVTFTTDSNTYNCATGLVTYNQGENSTGNSSGIDNFFSGTKTPAYAHTYLLSSVLSSDYEDLSGDGPTDDDLGAYTNFIYTNKEDAYKWRVPYSKAPRQASYDAGLNTSRSDQKGNYIYGEKEIKYIDRIVTKTHVAIFELSPRKDARGAAGKDGGIPSSGSQQMYKINKIRLYSKPEAIAANILDNDTENDLPITAIKTAHFVYDYSQCKNIENNHGETPDEPHELSNQGGKLTLQKVYFTYRESEMGKYTPYTFNYGTGEYVDGKWVQDTKSNPDYNMKSYDIWGNYKPNIGGGCNTIDPITAPEFPYVQQEDQPLQNSYASAWTLTSIDLPSGGRMEMEYETDDYQYVQDRKAMQMFKVVGAGENATSSDPESNHKLYKTNGILSDNEAKYLYVKLPKETEDISNEQFRKKYLVGIEGKPVYFRFLMNMTKSAASSNNNNNYDYVTGYFEIDGEAEVFKVNNDVYAGIPMKKVLLEGGIEGRIRKVNPISKAGWYFGRQYLNGLIYGLNMDQRSENLESIAKNLITSVAAMKDLITGPNKKLRSNEYLCAQRFIPSKSWIRLGSPENKLGGGVRVKQLVMKDQWSKMVDPTINDSNQLKLYNKEYGQTYTYELEDGSSSGVATYEPNQSKENPFVEPFYNKAERLVAPREVNYVEKPFGEAYFPSASVNYSRITVSNLQRDGIKKHATGRVVSEYFTSRDYPTKVDYTDISADMVTNQNDFLKNMLKGILGAPISMETKYTLSQGFTVHTNDMNGKMRSQKVYAENGDVTRTPNAEEKPISSVTYVYSTEEGDDTKLNNKLPVIHKNGEISNDRQIGVDYDVINDFRESYSKSQTLGFKGNIVVLQIGPLPVPVPMVVPSKTTIENVAHAAITTKAIHTTAVLKEKIAMDLGSKVSTINEAWDAETGQVLLTRTVNEFDDEYFNFNFPAYWSYSGMSQASKNIGITGTLINSGQFFTINDAKKYFTLGDEIIASYGFDYTERLWVVGFNNAGNGVLLMDRNGGVVNKSDGVNIDQPIQFKIVRSGHRNQQMANMGAITMMKNPIKDSSGNYVEKIDTTTFSMDANTPASDNLRIVNSSAVAYKDFWNCQCESQLPFIAKALEDKTELEDVSQEDYPFAPVQFNPYLYNAKGEWRAERSFAYLTERTDVNEGNTSSVNTRREGYFKEFTPYYAKTTEGDWQKSEDADKDWTFASQVTQYGPYGVELENRDALNRYSSAQYGYNFTLPTAVSSNSQYRDMGMDNFEDYGYQINREQSGQFDSEAHFNFKKAADDDGNEGVRISEEISHTGRTSLLVPGNDKAELVRHLQGELEPDTDYDGDGILNPNDKCPYDKGSNTDYDDDGIGDICDDDPVPQLTSKQKIRGHIRFDYTTPGNLNPDYEYCNARRGRFIIQGNPNDQVPYQVNVLHFEDRGFACIVNGELTVTNTGNVRTYKSEIKLDVTGKAEVIIDLGVRNRGSGKRDNVARVLFSLIDKGDGSILRNKDTGEESSFNLFNYQRFKGCRGGSNGIYEDYFPE
ncbi:hypothetical protein [uncultured Aquimarina sp.]|uniref:hypothetical protein n=1 Tax=uncultured Aquimarina sp. TaxID=575652 RepID=UPI002625FD24|nr:hypothetical protein [uncultured Aquimarina sp.]